MVITIRVYQMPNAERRREVAARLRGNEIRTEVPCCRTLVTSSVPPAARTNSRAWNAPIPWPLRFVVRKGANNCSLTNAGSMPHPLSSMVMMASVGVPVRQTVTGASGPDASTALVMTCVRTDCRSCSGMVSQSAGSVSLSKITVLQLSR